MVDSVLMRLGRLPKEGPRGASTGGSSKRASGCGRIILTMPNRSVESSGSMTDLASRVEQVINLIRPAVQSDGGDVEFVELTPDRVVRIRLHGACVGCPSSNVTLQMGIERNLRAHVPEITRVEAID